MVYKVNVTNKRDLEKIRYVGDDISKLREIIKLDNLRDLSVYFMMNNPGLSYDKAYLVAKGEMNLSDALKVEEPVDSLDNVIEKEKVKVKVLQLDNDNK
ncbi:MAG TPA: hypothetical protein PLV83_01560 [Bacilli bacterium]|nr:hypothetical protein [Bacilli bacterium]